VARLGRNDPFRRPRIQKLETPDIARLGIAYVPENMGIFAGLTVRENLLLAARAARPTRSASSASSHSSRR
jgi:ABC-type branched-subunit amino acid transport system ATPase component